MPRRRRAREFQRRLRQAVEQVEAEVAAQEAAATSGHPLDDKFWREREQGMWCCPACDYNHPLTIKAAAIEEIAAYKEMYA